MQQFSTENIGPKGEALQDKLRPETVIKLNKFIPRTYQQPLLDAYENKGYKRIIAVLPRRAGKDVAAWNLAIRQCIRKTLVCYYILPTFAMARRIIWDAVLNNSMRFLDFIPRELVESMNASDMKIRFTNGSLLQLCGSDNVDALVGTNPKLIIYSEYALQDPRAYQFLRPIVLANEGSQIFVSTPRGKNHFFELYQIALQNPEWFCYKMTVEETGHIPLHEIAKERAEGLMSDDLIDQEYYCSWLGQEGAFYTKYIDRMRLENRITVVPFESHYGVNLSFDIGYNDNTCIVFYQCVNQIVRVIDYYSNSLQGLEHYVKILRDKERDLGYNYKKIFGPHDISVHEWGSGLSRIEKARQLGIKFETQRNAAGHMVSALPNLSLEDGIEAVRSSFSRMWIDETKCSELIKCLENYRREYDTKTKLYKDHPLHNHWSHGADAFRYMVLSLSKTRDGLSAQELDTRYKEAVMGENANMPEMFR